MGERTDPMALSSRKGQFTVKWDEGAEKGENRVNGPVLHSVSHGVAACRNQDAFPNREKFAATPKCIVLELEWVVVYIGYECKL
jgi:hypothetical protein